MRHTWGVDVEQDVLLGLRDQPAKSGADHRLDMGAHDLLCGGQLAPHQRWHVAEEEFSNELEKMHGASTDIWTDKRTRNTHKYSQPLSVCIWVNKSALRHFWLMVA